MNWLPRIGQSNEKSESRADTTVKQIESLCKTGKQHATDVMSALREMESKLLTLKNEKEFFVRELNRYETQKQNFNNKDRKIMLHEVDTQTESDMETAFSIENDTLRSRNKYLQQSIAELKERLNQEVAPSGGNIIANVASTALFSEDKYFPVGSELKKQYEALLAEYEIVCKEKETIKRDKDSANNEIQKLGVDLVEAKTTHKQREDQHIKQVEEIKRQLEVLNADVIEFDKQKESEKNESHSTYYRIENENQKLNGLIREHEQTIKEFKEGLAGKINQLEQQEATITKLKQEINDNKILLEQKGIQEKAKERQKNELHTMIVQLQGNIDVSEKELKQKEIQLNSLQKEVDEVTRKLKNELSLESFKVQNGKTRIDELEHTVIQLMNKLEDVKCVKQRESDKNESCAAFQCDNQRLSGIIKEHEQIIKEFKEGIARKINQLEQQEATITKLKQEINDNKILLEQKGIQEKAKESQKNELHTMIVQLQGNVDVSEKQLNIHLSKLKNMQVERDDLKAENDRFKTELKKFSQLEGSYTIRGKAIEDKKIEIDKMGKELKQKEIQINSLQKEVGDVTRKLKNELSLESVNVQNGKSRINELEHTVTQLQNKLEDAKRVKEELENRQLLVTQEKTNFEGRMEELVNKYENMSTINTALVHEIESWKKEKEKITARALKKCISFHCVLKQPQSDQAVGGIVSLLQQQFGNVDLEIIEEAKRGKDVPLLVVLYNLSRLTNDAKEALRDIEAASDVALVVLHSKEVLKPSDQILTLSNMDVRKLGIIVDMGFISAKGIISNELTSNGVKQLVGFINKF